MEIVHEITAFLENKPGRLAKICSSLAHEKVNIRALSVMDSGVRSVLRFVTDQVDEARKVLTSLGTEHSMADLIAVEIDNKPGAIAKILEKLALEHINIEYAYGANAANGKALGIFHTNNPKKAMQLLSEVSSSNGEDHSSGRRPLHSR
jgi:hypothetical protein